MKIDSLTFAVLVHAMAIVSSVSSLANAQHWEQGESHIMVFRSEEPKRPHEIEISGPVTPWTAERIAQVLATPANFSALAGLEFTVYLNSLGGDIDAAIAIGRTLHKRGARMVVRKGSSCASACVLILVAGMQRDVLGGRVGIHRPYSSAVNAATKSTPLEEYRQMSRRVQGYLGEVGASSRLYEAMMKVPAERVVWMSEEQLLDLRIVGKSSEYADFLDSRAAAHWGLSKQEFLKRKGVADRVCNADLLLSESKEDVDRYVGCWQGIVGKKN